MVDIRDLENLVTLSTLDSIPGAPITMEVCTDPRTSKIFLAIATVSSNYSDISFVEVISDGSQDVSLIAPSYTTRNKFPYTKLAHSPDLVLKFLKYQ